MKKIIEGKLYNTETATLIAEYNNGYPTGDFYYYIESLYQKKNGEYFISYHGGPLSKYGASQGRNSVYGNGIFKLTKESAMQWAARYLSADKYIELFGEVEE